MKNADKPAQEEWRPIGEFLGLYEVSNIGNIRSCNRLIIYKGRNRHQNYKAQPIKIAVHKSNGYCYVGLTDYYGKQHSRRVHRLVAQAFIPNPENLPEVNHEDFDKQNNTVPNLKWCDQFYQNQHAAKKEGRKWQHHRLGMTGCLNPASRPVVAIGSDGLPIGYFESGAQAAKALSVNQSKVSACCLGKINHTKQIKFQFA